jgi:undecaprenyl-diphosphatase
VALVVFFWREWVAVVQGFFATLRKRRIDTAPERMAWLLVLGTIPVGIVGLVFEHNLRTLFAKPTAAAIFLTVNGLILLAGERLRRRAAVRALVDQHAHHTDAGHDVGRDLETLELREGIFVGSAQILALFAGISRSGVTMVAGLLRGLDHEDAARLSFMLATPVILAAGVYKLPDLAGHNGDGIRGQVLVGSICAGVAAYASVRFLTRFFRTRTLTPFAIYSLVVGIGMIVYLNA